MKKSYLVLLCKWCKYVHLKTHYASSKSSRNFMPVVLRQNKFSNIGPSPLPSIAFCCGLSVLLVVTNSVEVLILNTSYASVVGSALAVSALIRLRLTRDDLYLPLRLPIALPIIFLGIFFVLLVLPFTIPDKRLHIAVSFILIAAGIPVYVVLIWWKNKPKLFAQIDKWTLRVAQKLFIGLPEAQQATPNGGDIKLE